MNGLAGVSTPAFFYAKNQRKNAGWYKKNHEQYLKQHTNISLLKVNKTYLFYIF